MLVFCFAFFQIETYARYSDDDEIDDQKSKHAQQNRHQVHPQTTHQHHPTQQHPTQQHPTQHHPTQHHQTQQHHVMPLDTAHLVTNDLDPKMPRADDDNLLDPKLSCDMFLQSSRWLSTSLSSDPCSQNGIHTADNTVDNHDVCGDVVSSNNMDDYNEDDDDDDDDDQDRCTGPSSDVSSSLVSHTTPLQLSLANHNQQVSLSTNKPLTSELSHSSDQLHEIAHDPDCYDSVNRKLQLHVLYVDNISFQKLSPIQRQQTAFLSQEKLLLTADLYDHTIGDIMQTYPIRTYSKFFCYCILYFF